MHLALLCSFLRGDSLDSQLSLFFWAYQFDVIPIELLSSIYEEFYHSENVNDDKGTHYTPPTLVSFVLANPSILEKLKIGKVLDFACGSGIFLVEAFRRMVYHQMRERGRRLRPQELQKILRERVFGVDRNGEAVRVAAFSLYLALLDFMEPSDIRRHKLSLLIHDANELIDQPNGFNLFEANAFFLLPEERALIVNRLQTKKYKGRILDLQIVNWPLLPLRSLRYDVIVGNPPWGEPMKNDPDGQRAVQWCQSFNLPIGDNELSQCFIWRTLNLLADDGIAGLLVSSGVFFKRHPKSLALAVC